MQNKIFLSQMLLFAIEVQAYKIVVNTKQKGLL